MFNMRYHTFKSSTTKNLLISDSHAKNPFFPNFNILSITGGRIKDVWLFLPSPSEFEIIVLFIGGNDLFEFQRLSGISSQSAADKISELAEHFKELSSKVFIIGIPPRLNRPERSLAVNSLLAEKFLATTSWQFRGISSSIYNCDFQTKSNDVHRTEKALSGIKSILKKKILRNQFNAAVDNVGHKSLFVCSGKCRCGSARDSYC